jgi:hypothetical protein
MIYYFSCFEYMWKYVQDNLKYYIASRGKMVAVRQWIQKEVKCKFIKIQTLKTIKRVLGAKIYQ